MANLSPRFLDGKTSRPFDVRVALSEQSVIILSGENVLAKWPLSDVFVKEDWGGTVGGTFGVRHSPDAGLVVYQKALFDRIQGRLSHRDKATFIVPTHSGSLLLLAVLAVAATVMLFPVISHLASFIAYAVPPSLEDKLGDMAADDLQKTFPRCDDKDAAQALQKIVGRLVVAHGDKAMAPVISLHKSPMENAFTLPGTRMAVLTGFLKQAKDENEIAAVLAHEMGHMVRHDPLEAFIEAEGFGLIAGLMGSSGAYGDVAKVASLVQTLRYSRDKEFAADKFGAHLLQKAGYSPVGLSAFLSRMDASQTGTVAELSKHLEVLSTHPDTDERVRRIRAFRHSGQYKASLSTAEFLRLKEACKK